MNKLAEFFIDMGIIITIFVIVYELEKQIRIKSKNKSKKIIAWIFVVIGISSLFIRRFCVQIDTYYATIFLAMGFSNFTCGLTLLRDIKNKTV